MSTDKKDFFNFGISGCGSIGPTHVGAVGKIPNARLLAVADILPDRVKGMAEKYSIPRAYASHEELLKDPEIDVVCICTPSGMHVNMAIQAMKAGKHVVIEKPVDVSLEACDRLIAAEIETGKKATIISQHRFDSDAVLLKKMIDSGKLGKIILADAYVKWYRHQKYYDSANWRGTWALDGGGALINQGVHTVDVLQWLVGGVKTIFGHTLNGAHDRIEVEDVAVGAMTYNCGAVGTITASTASWEGQPVRIDIYGTLGGACLEGDRLKWVKMLNGETLIEGGEATKHAVSVAQGGTASVKHEAAKVSAAGAGKDFNWGDSHRAQIVDLLNAIQTGTQPLNDPRLLPQTPGNHPRPLRIRPNRQNDRPRRPRTHHQPRRPQTTQTPPRRRTPRPVSF